MAMRLVHWCMVAVFKIFANATLTSTRCMLPEFKQPCRVMHNVQLTYRFQHTLLNLLTPFIVSILVKINQSPDDMDKYIEYTYKLQRNSENYIVIIVWLVCFFVVFCLRILVFPNFIFLRKQ